MGCENKSFAARNNDLDTGSIFSSNNIYFIARNGVVKKGILLGLTIDDTYPRMVRIDYNGDKITLPKDRVFPTEKDAHLSMLSCEIERKIPELLDSSITDLYIRERPKIYKRWVIYLIKRWNNILDKLKINGYEEKRTSHRV